MYVNLLGGFNHLETWKRLVNGKDYSMYMENKKCSKPPTSNVFFYVAVTAQDWTHCICPKIGPNQLKTNWENVHQHRIYNYIYIIFLYQLSFESLHAAPKLLTNKRPVHLGADCIATSAYSFSCRRHAVPHPTPLPWKGQATARKIREGLKQSYPLVN